jgi:hypothetical protein
MRPTTGANQLCSARREASTASRSASTRSRSPAGENEAFPGVLKEIRDNLDQVVAALDEIEKDDTLDLSEGEAEGAAAEDKPAAEKKPKKK